MSYGFVYLSEPLNYLFSCWSTLSFIKIFCKRIHYQLPFDKYLPYTFYLWVCFLMHMKLYPLGCITLLLSVLGCVRGQCVQPNKCECDFGYVGVNCSIQCLCNGHSDCEGPDKLETCLKCHNNTMVMYFVMNIRTVISNILGL